MLEITLAEILHAINPTREDVEIRMRIIDELQYVVSSIDCFKGAAVEPFGSFLSQLFSRWGDLDISVELPNGSHILVPAKKHKQTLLGDLQKALRKTGSFRRLQFVTHARVPILKLESRIQNISCDISINNLSGLMKSKFLLWISHIDRRFHDMVLLVKEWAKANGINNPRSGTFNSYSLSLLVIFHFQTCAPAILPRLEDLYPRNIADELTGVRSDVERRIEELAIGNIEIFRQRRSHNHSSLSQLFVSFLGKFLDISTRTKEQGISTYRGRWENISTNTRWLPRTYAIFIEDPFEQPVNTARAVSQSRLTRISEAFRNTYYLLIDPNQSRNSFIPSLVRQEISQFFPGAAFAIPMPGLRPHPWSNQNAPRCTFAPFGHQFQTRHVNQPKNSKVQNGKLVSQGWQVTRVKLGGQCPNVDQQKTAQQCQEQVPPVPPEIVSPENSKVKNRKQLSVSREAPRVKPGRQRQNAYRQKPALQYPEQVSPAPSQAVHLKNSKVENGKQLCIGREAPRVKPGRQRQNAYRPKPALQYPEQVSPAPSQAVHLKNSKVENGKQLCIGREAPRIKPGRHRQNAGRQKTAQQCQEQVPSVSSRVVNLKNMQVENGKILSLDSQAPRVNPGRQRQSVYRQNGSQVCRGQVPSAPSHVIKPKNLKVQNGKLFSVGRHAPRVKLGRKFQNVDRQNNAQEHQVQVPPAPSQLANQKNLKVQNGKKLSPIVKPGSKCHNVDQQNTGEHCQEQVSPDLLQVVNPPWPHTLQPRPNNDVAVLPSLKASPAAQA